MLKQFLWVFGIVAVYGLAVLFRFNHVHAESGEWRDRPTAEPPIVRYHGHTYDRGATDTARQVGFAFHGTDPGNGVILAPKHDPNPTMIQVTSKHVVATYRLAS